MYKIIFYVPPDHLEDVKNALFAAGAGQLGDYDCCAWEVLGQGQYRPLRGSQAYVGNIGVVETLPEYMVELVCSVEYIHAAIDALKKAHPYETPAYQVIRCEEI